MLPMPATPARHHTAPPGFEEWLAQFHAWRAWLEDRMSACEQALAALLISIGDSSAPAKERKTRAVPRRASKPKSTRTANAEQRARAVWHDGMTVRELARASKLSMSAASKWAKVLRDLAQ